MSGGATLYAILSANAPLAALVGTRIYPMNVPNDKALPAIAYKRSATEYHTTIHGDAPASTVVYDLVCGAKTGIEAEAVGDALENIGELFGLDRSGRVDDYDPETGIYITVVTVVIQVPAT